MCVTVEMWDRVLLLLAVMVVADERVRDEEITAFADGARALQDALEPDEPLAVAALPLWFTANEDRARAIVAEDDFTHALVRPLSALAEFPDKQGLLNALASIADSDQHRAPSEADVLTLAAAFWGLVRPD